MHLATRPLGHFATLVLLSALLFFPAIVNACPGCKEALFDPGQLQQKLSTAQGYAWSIALLLACPAVLVLGVTALVVRASRRRNRDVGRSA